MFEKPMKAAVRLASLGAIAAVVLGASAAQARDAECLWDHLPPDKVSAGLTAGMEQGPGAFMNVLTDADLAVATKACGYDASPQEAIASAMGGLILQKMSEAWLSSKADLTPARLDAAWNGLDAPLKEKLSAWVGAHNPEDPLVAQARAAFTKALGLTAEPPDETSRKFIIYMAGRTMRAQAEPRL
jgi:hypothetical protein